MASIIDFLEARIAEDDAVARAAGTDALEWRSFSGSVQGGPFIEPDPEWAEEDDEAYGSVRIVYDEGAPSPAGASHIARWDPARVLAECAAKRAIAGLHKVGADQCDEHNAMFESIPCSTIRALAAVYKDHPDYQQEWA
ncbi:hypothetical protein PP636_gp55 [Arthrobacter phage Hestia]|uniref:Uncharacterized protein n=1 Tax=Arthrobacter phage Hestia TaxID=2419609 RepID=A0A3G3M4E2_9CAUD|nr:hypothetical protein PP636_gp55 [Arthrobacter phage Hestia]AYR00918.1 hypothetical protein PBI_HESTIA_40 [Arthrobacter phage Hestia]